MAAPIHPRGGRPRLFDTKASAHINLKVTPAQHLELKRVASDNGLSLSAVLRDAVLEYCAERAERRERQG